MACFHACLNELPSELRGFAFKDTDLIYIHCVDHRLASEVELSSILQASRRSMPGTDYVSAINVHICRSVVPGRDGGHVPGRSAAYENQALCNTLKKEDRAFRNIGKNISLYCVISLANFRLLKRGESLFVG